MPGACLFACVTDFNDVILPGTSSNSPVSDKSCLNQKGCNFKCLLLGGDYKWCRESWTAPLRPERKGMGGAGQQAGRPGRGPEMGAGGAPSQVSLCFLHSRAVDVPVQAASLSDLTEGNRKECCCCCCCCPREAGAGVCLAV